MNKQVFEVPVEIDELALSVLGWEGEARLRISANIWEGDEGDPPDVTYSYALSGTFHFNEEDWTTRYTSSSEYSYMNPLLLEIHCPPLGETFHETLFVGDKRDVQKRPLRVSEQGKLGYGLPLVAPERFQARITAFDGIDVFGDDGFEAFKTEVPVKIISELPVVPFTPTAKCRAYLSSEQIIIEMGGTIAVGSTSELEEASKALRYFGQEEDEQVDLPLPEIEVEILDATGFVLEDWEPDLGWFYRYRSSVPRAARPPRWMVKTTSSLKSLSGVPAEVVVRFIEGSE